MSWLSPAAVGSGLAGAAVVGKCGPGQNSGASFSLLLMGQTQRMQIKEENSGRSRLTDDSGRSQNILYNTADTVEIFV